VNVLYAQTGQPWPITLERESAADASGHWAALVREAVAVSAASSDSQVGESAADASGHWAALVREAVAASAAPPDSQVEEPAADASGHWAALVGLVVDG